MTTALPTFITRFRLPWVGVIPTCIVFTSTAKITALRTTFSDDPNRVRLAQFGFRLRERFLYEYDFYDNWKHDIRLEKVLPLNSKRVFPVCTAGQRPVPLEDCGGARAYREEGDPRWLAWCDAMPGEDLRLIAGTVKRFLDSSGDRSVIGDRESLMVAVERVKAHSNLRPDQINRREINRRLQQYARGDREWLFCDRIG